MRQLCTAMRTVALSTLGVALLALVLQTSKAAGATDEPANSAAVESGANAGNASTEFKPRQPAELRKAVSDALRAEAAAKDHSKKDKAIRQLMLIYLELEQDQNLSHDERLELHTVVRSRLQSIEKSLRAEIARDHPAATTDVKVAAKSRAIETTPQSIDVAVLAQQIAAPPVAPGPPGAGGNAAANRLAANGGVIGRLQPPDFGQDLVDLIHNVISPRTWDVNGGPGSVVYFRNFRVLVVQSTIGSAESGRRRAWSVAQINAHQICEPLKSIGNLRRSLRVCRFRGLFWRVATL